MMQEALGELQRQHNLLKQNDKSSQDETLRPLLKTLVDAYDALSLAEARSTAFARQRTDDDRAVPVAAPSVPPPAIKLKIPHWAAAGSVWMPRSKLSSRRCTPGSRRRAGCRRRCTWTILPERHRQSLDALLVGYRMSLQRIDRALTQQGLEVIACVGEPFDPETMEVAEVVREEGRTGTEVLQEIRRGYRCAVRLFRYAHVRVAKP